MLLRRSEGDRRGFRDGISKSKAQNFLFEQAKFREGNLNFRPLKSVRRTIEGFSAAEEHGFGYLYLFEEDFVIGFL
jgi:hypothetical protein